MEALGFPQRTSNLALHSEAEQASRFSRNAECVGPCFNPKRSCSRRCVDRTCTPDYGRTIVAKGSNVHLWRSHGPVNQPADHHRRAVAFGDQITAARPLISGVRISAMMHVQPGGTRGLCTRGGRHRPRSGEIRDALAAAYRRGADPQANGNLARSSFRSAGFSPRLRPRSPAARQDRRCR